jgi:hypothetical protein
MLSLLARDKILLKQVQKIDAFGLYGTGPKDKKKSSASPAPHQVFDTLLVVTHGVYIPIYIVTECTHSQRRPL